MGQIVPENTGHSYRFSENKMCEGGPHVPLRTCVVCGLNRTKEFLFRLVSTTDGSIVEATNVGKPGRGAYICKVRKCIEASAARGRVGFSLRRNVKYEEWNDLISNILLCVF